MALHTGDLGRFLAIFRPALRAHSKSVGFYTYVERKSRMFMALQNEVSFNAVKPLRYALGLSHQVYWPAVFRFEPDEALILEPGCRTRAATGTSS